MTLKELLDEQKLFVEIKQFSDGVRVRLIKVGKSPEIENKMFASNEMLNQTIENKAVIDATDFLRQNTIETVKWVIKLSTELEKEKWETGKPKGLIDLIFELKKSIEDHA